MKKVEKRVMVKRGAEKAAVAKQRAGRTRMSERQGARAQHRRSLSADKLSNLHGTNERSSKRQSIPKVED